MRSDPARHYGEPRAAIAEPKWAKMLAVRLCGPRVLIRLESIGVRQLADLRSRDPWELMQEINVESGRPIWRLLAIRALQNLIDTAEREAAPSRDQEHG